MTRAEQIELSLQKLQDVYHEMEERIDKLETERDRLTEIAAGADDGGHWYSQQTMDAVVKEREELRAKNQRLLKALNKLVVAISKEDISESQFDEAVTEARALQEAEG